LKTTALISRWHIHLKDDTPGLEMTHFL
jgi:hypothetical protein